MKKIDNLISSPAPYTLCYIDLVGYFTMGTMDVDWDVVSEVATTCGTDRRTTSRVIGLFNSGNTLPFIARYRKEATGNLDPDALRAIKNKLSQCKYVPQKKHLLSLKDGTIIGTLYF